MPFTFIDIEKKRTKEIVGLFIFLVFFYFFGAWLLTVSGKAIFTLRFVKDATLSQAFSLSAKTILKIFGISFLVAIFHWYLTTYNNLSKIVDVLKAKPPDPDDSYHQMFKNIVEEVSVATGGRKIDSMVLPVFAMNAFAISDLKKRSVIGVTEGLLSKLNRAQIEAVVAHEAGHIVRGDTLVKTVIISLFSVFGVIHEKFKYVVTLGFYRNRVRCGYRGRNQSGFNVFLWFASLVMYLISGLLYMISKLVSMFISRKCEYRADAVAVRLVRDPLSLAQALNRISKGWRGGGLGFDSMESIFIMNPNFSQLDEKESSFAAAFSTHPPVEKRLEKLLNLGHSNLEQLEIDSKPKVKIKSYDVDVVKEKPSSENGQRWLIADGADWQGPFAIAELLTLGLIRQDSFIKREGSDKVMLAYQDEDLIESLKGPKQERKGKNLCPRCFVPLHKAYYEGTSVLSCSSCKGVFVDNDKIPRILIRDDRGFSAEIARQAAVVEKRSKEPFAANAKMKHDLKCPKCQQQMFRKFYNLAHLIEIDQCFECKATWFDTNELEILQYLVEKSATEEEQ